MNYIISQLEKMGYYDIEHQNSWVQTDGQNVHYFIAEADATMEIEVYESQSQCQVYDRYYDEEQWVSQGGFYK